MTDTPIGGEPPTEPPRSAAGNGPISGHAGRPASPARGGWVAAFVTDEQRRRSFND
jgi:hypothetical protein